MDFHALWQKAFAPALAASREGGPPALRAHTRPKTVLILSGALRALESAFHTVGN
jgi:hypothetical protein